MAKKKINMNEQEEKLLNELEIARDESNEAFQNLPSGLDWDEFQKAMSETNKKLSDISRRYRMAQTPDLTNDIPDYGDVMTLKSFISCCECGGFINDDGYGEYVKGKKSTGITIHPSDVKHGAIRTEFKKIVWFNR